jgi:hypothetical protein
MDDCLVDAVAYTGARGNSLRAAYREAMCELMGGQIKGSNQGLPKEQVTCSGMGRNSQTPVVLVPESLGSKIMMDALLSIRGENKGRALGPVKAIHIATNQIPLLSQADAEDTSSRKQMDSGGEAPGAKEFRTLVEQLSGGRSSAKRFGEKISVVVYTDPNDLLGYPLTEKWIPANGAATLTNVLVSNNYTYFGYVENPLPAHSGTTGPQVFRMVIEGSDPS